MSDDVKSPHLELAKFLDKKFSGEVDESSFYYFEPFDIKKRSDQVKEIARKDGVDLYSEEFLEHIGSDPHFFQTGYLLSTARMRTLLAGSRVGKTYPSNIELAIMISGEKPLSLRFPEGHNTNVKRLVTTDNIIRFGRHDSKTGEFLDFNVNAIQPVGWKEWDCGCIQGMGIYPDEKIAPPGSVCWVGTTHQALIEQWWPRLTGGAKNLFPLEFIDTKRGNAGYAKSIWTVYCVRETRLAVISYESGFRKYEAEEAWGVVFDEESPDRACVTSAINHCKYFSMVMTPYLGMTYTKGLIFDSKKDKKNNQVFHCSAYDSPYLTLDTINHRRSLMKLYEIGARIWGIHTEAAGKPYFDRDKLNVWIRKFKTSFELFRFMPMDEWDGMASRIDHEKSGLMDVDVTAVRKVKEEDERDVWKIYEDVEEGQAYYLMADSAEGSDIPSEAGDVLASLVMRLPKDNEEFPQIVASLRSTLRTVNFARVCAYATRYYNNALLCAEGPTRGSFNAMFFGELKDYPYWFKQPSMRDSTKRARMVQGFDTNAATREAMFKGIEEVLNEFDENERPEIRDEALMKELAACIIKVKNGRPRPDHSSRGTLDTSICYGQGLWIWKNCSSQIKCRVKRGDKRTGFLDRMRSEKKEELSNPLYLGERVVSLR